MIPKLQPNKLSEIDGTKCVHRASLCCGYYSKFYRCAIPHIKCTSALASHCGSDRKD
jgi:hypothetical protein